MMNDDVLSPPPESDLDASVPAPVPDQPAVPGPLPAVVATPSADVEGLKAALIAERRHRQDLERELATTQTPPPPPATPEAAEVPDEDAERFARRYELYTAQGLDLVRAKQMIADNRADMRRVAAEAVEQAITPVRADHAKQGAREQFLRVASRAVHEGNLDEAGVKTLVERWIQLPPELAADPDVADHVLESVIGAVALARKPVAARQEPPVFSERSGGERPGPYTMSTLEKRVARGRGISDKDWETTAKTYQPGGPNPL